MHTPNNGKTSDPFFSEGGVAVIQEGRVFILPHWIGSQWSVHRFSLPTVVSPWTDCSSLVVLMLVFCSLVDFY